MRSSSYVTRVLLLRNVAPSNPKLTAVAGGSLRLSSHTMIASGSMKRRISHADARRSTKSGVRVAHARRKYLRLDRATPASGERGASSGKIIAWTFSSISASTVSAFALRGDSKKSSVPIASSS